MKTKLIASGIVVALIAGTAIKLFSNKAEVENNIYRLNPERKVLVKADTVSLRQLGRTFTYTGTFAAYREVMIVPQIQGEAVGVYFNEGDLVGQGQRLLQVDDELLQAQYPSALASFETAKRNYERYKNAATGGGVSQMQIDNYWMNFKNAESQLKHLSKQISLSKLDAPFTGTITYKDVEKGSVVGGAPVARVTDLSKLKLEIIVPEKEIALFRKGDKIVIHTDVYPHEDIFGKVDYISARGDAAHGYTVKVLVDNSKPGIPLRAGMYGTASVAKDLDASTIVAPRSALLGSAKNPQVFVIANNVATLRSITMGSTNDETVEVLSGLEPGDIVATSGQINLTEGSRIEIIR